MDNGNKETMRIRMLSAGFAALALAVFKPFGLDTWHWQAYFHLLAIWVLGVAVCMLTDVILKYIIRMPRLYNQGVSYIIRRNLWFQLINTPLVALLLCLYRHFILSNRVEGNQLSWANYLETLIIFAFCSFAIGLYWRFKFRSRFLTAELEETRLLNEQLRKVQEEVEQRAKKQETVQEEASNLKQDDTSTPAEKPQHPDTIILKGTTSETVTVQIHHLLYIEAVGNYVKLYQLRDGQTRSEMLRATTKQIEENLKDYPMIVRCHRAFLVNLQQVEQIVSRSGSMQLLIKHIHETIPVSRSNMAQIKHAINHLTPYNDDKQ